MRIPHLHWKMFAATILLLAMVWPAQAARFRRYNYQVATFQLANTAQIAVNSNQGASLLNLQRGERVNVVYDQENGALVAHRVTAVATHNPKPLSSGLRSSGHQQTAQPNYWNVHGVISSVNPQAGTFTIVYKPQ